MPAIILKSSEDGIKEYLMIELQGDIECRLTEEIQDCNGKFVGDLHYNKFGHPILIIGHHILFGKEKEMEKPFALIEKIPITQSMEVDEDEELKVHRKFDASTVPDDTVPNVSFSILDTTVNIENRTKIQIEYRVRALIKKKLVFSQRPRPIVSNLPKTN